MSLLNGFNELGAELDDTDIDDETYNLEAHAVKSSSDKSGTSALGNRKLRQWTTAIIANSSLMAIGMFLGWSSPVIQKLKQPDSEIRLTDAEISWMISLVYIGSVVSPLLTGMLMDRCGRKSALYLTIAEAMLSWILLLLSNSVNGIYASRFIGGLVSGSGITVAPIYLSEIAEPELRGGINSLFSVMSYIGIMFEYTAGPLVSYTTLNALSLAAVTFIGALLYFIPETPYYYTMKENRVAAIKSLAWLRGSNAAGVENELNLIDRAVSENMKAKRSVFDLLKTKGNRKALFITEILAFIQRMVGISVIMAYASSAAPSSWILTNDQCAIIFCLTWIVFSLLSTVLVDRFGRKSLLILSCIGCFIAQSSYGIFNYLEINSNLDVQQYDWFRFASLMVFSIFYPVGLGCVPSIIQGEMFAPNVKGTASGVTSIVYAMASFITNKTFQPVGDAYGYYINYLIYSATCVVGLFFTIFILIETKGRTLEEIQDDLNSKPTPTKLPK